MKKIFLGFLTAVMVFGLVACAKTLDATYKATKIIVGEASMDLDADAYEGYELYITFKNDGKATMKTGEEESEYTYTVDGDGKLTLAAGEGQINGTLDGDKLTVTIEQTNIEFEKQ